MNWIILEKPYILIFLVISVLLNFYDKKKQASKGIITILSLLIYVGGLAFLSLAGAGYQELILLLLIFLLFNFDYINDWGARE